LVGEPKLAIVELLGRQLLPVYQIGFASPIETDGDFQHQEQIVAGGPDSRHDLRDSIRFGERIIDGASQFFDQPLEVVVEVQESPESVRLVPLHSDSMTGLEALSRRNVGLAFDCVRDRPYDDEVLLLAALRAREGSLG